MSLFVLCRPVTCVAMLFQVLGSGNAIGQCQPPANNTLLLPQGVVSAVGVADNFGNIYVVGGNIDGQVPFNPVPTSAVRRFRESGGVLVDTTNVAPVMPPMAVARAEHAGASDRHGRLYVFGGWDGVQSTPLASCERYDPLTNAWVSVAPLPSARGYCRAVASLDGMSLFVIGGQSSANTATNSVFRYDVATNTWATDQPMLFDRTLHGVGVGKDGTIYAVGALYQQPSTTFEARNPFTGAWKQLASPPVFVEQAAACYCDNAGRVHLMGAYQNGSWLSETTHQVFDPKYGVWSTCASWSPPTNNMAAVAADSGCTYLFGGMSLHVPLSTIREVTVPGVMLSVTQYGGLGSVDVRLVNGTPGHLGLTVITLNPMNNSGGGVGGLGTGWWGGLHASLQDVLNGVGAGAPPGWMFLDGSGSATWSLPTGSLSFLAGFSFFVNTHLFDPLTFGWSDVSYSQAITLR